MAIKPENSYGNDNEWLTDHGGFEWAWLYIRYRCIYNKEQYVPRAMNGIRRSLNCRSILFCFPSANSS